MENNKSFMKERLKVTKKKERYMWLLSQKIVIDKVEIAGTIANSLNNFFVNIGLNLASKIPKDLKFTLAKRIQNYKKTL